MTFRYGFLCLIALLSGSRAMAQNAQGCDGSRYLQDLFPQVKKTTLQYASNSDNIGLPVDLYLDIYEPQGDDLEARPVVLLAHGGSFISGSKADMQDFCQSFARKGYVAVSVQYRLWNFAGGFPDATGFITTCYRAISDFKGAIRWLRYDADQENQFRIDPERIFVGGVSAGSITAMHATYMDSTDAITPQVNGVVTQQGGWEGNTGNAGTFGYPTTAIGVIDIVGALFDSTFIQAGDPPILSIHGTADETVPYGAGSFLGQIQLHGSSCLYNRALEVGVPAYLVTVPGGSHALSEASSLPYVLEYQNGIVSRMEDILCQTSSVQETAGSGPSVSIYPNPAKGFCHIEISTHEAGQGMLSLYDAMGRKLQQERISSGENHSLSLADRTPGLYYLHFDWDQAGSAVRKLLIE